MTKIVSAWQLVARRSLSQWKLLSSLVLGVVLASAVMAGTVIYFDALRELALESTLADHPITELDLLTRVERGPTNRGEYDTVSGLVDGEVDSTVQWLLRDRLRGGKTATFFLTPPGAEESAGDDNARTYFAFLPGREERTTLADGRMPNEQALNAPGDPLKLEALIPLEAAQRYQVGVGDQLSAVPHWEDRVPYVSVEVVGVLEKNDPSAEYWRLDTGVLQSATGPSFKTVPFYLSETTYFEVLGPAFLSMDSVYAWLFTVEPGRLNARNSSEALGQIRAMESTLSTLLSGYANETALTGALQEYDRRIFFSRLPMFVVLILIAVVVLYYVATLSSLAVEQRRSEIALLRSRGATSVQILAVFVLEGATIALLAVLAGPILAALAISVLGVTPAFSDLTGGVPLSVSISGGAYSLSALGGALSLVALVLPAVPASRIGVTRQRQQAARPSALPAFQKYYLDVLLLAASLILFRQLTEQGSVLATKVFGEVLVDQLLLAVPGLILVASALILLRLFPLVMGLASRVLSPVLPAGVAMGVWQMARNPAHYARLSLLIILAAGLGIFASSFGATLELSFEQRVLYATGSDVRVDGARLNGRCVAGTWGSCNSQVPIDGPVRLDEAFRRVSGVDHAAAVLRARGQDLSKGFGQSYEMLGVDVDRFGDGNIAWFRDDFAEEPLTRMFESLKAARPLEGIVLPENARTIGVRLRADRPQPGVRVTARIRNAQGRFSSYFLGHLNSTDWMVLEEELDFRIRQSLEFDRPLEIVALGVHQSIAGADLRAGSVVIDDIRVRTDRGETVIVETFDDTSQWGLLGTAPQSVSDVFVPADPSLDGGGMAILNWSGGRGLVNRGIAHGMDGSPVPVLASKGFVNATGHGGDEKIDVSVAGYRVPVRIAGTVDLFPTMNSLSKKFLIADTASLTDHANVGALFRELRPNEVWMSSATTGLEREQLIETLESDPSFLNEFVFDRVERLGEAQVDPLVSAGWRALLFLAFGTVLILSCLGFIVHAYVSFRSRELEFALLRTAGFSMRQLITTVSLEQVLVIGVGMGLGTWMGGRLGATIIPFLGHDDFGGQVVPPFVIEINWGALLLTYAAMFAVFAVIIMAVVWFIHRISLQKILRMGEL